MSYCRAASVPVMRSSSSRLRTTAVIGPGPLASYEAASCTRSDDASSVPARSEETVVTRDRSSVSREAGSRPSVRTRSSNCENFIGRSFLVSRGQPRV